MQRSLFQFWQRCSQTVEKKLEIPDVFPLAHMQHHVGVRSAGRRGTNYKAALLVVRTSSCIDTVRNSSAYETKLHTRPFGAFERVTSQSSICLESNGELFHHGGNNCAGSDNHHHEPCPCQRRSGHIGTISGNFGVSEPIAYLSCTVRGRLILWR